MISKNNLSNKGFVVSLFAAACCLVFFCVPASMHAVSDKNRPVVALVLEGGGALGFAHIGVIKVIEELGIPVDIVVGTSMGATIGGFYALGYSAARMEEIVSGADWVGILSEQVSSSEESYRDRIDRSRYFAKLDFDRMGFKIPGSLLTGRKLLSFLDRLTIAESSPVDFDSFPRRFRAIATDFTTGERVVIGSGSLSDALRASMGVPGVFAPYFVEGRYLVDGGIVDNLPVGIAKSLGADLIIAVDLEGDKPFVPDNTNQNPLNDMSRSLEIMIRSNVLREKPGADLVLSVDLSGYQTTDFQKMAEIIVRGEETAREHRPEIEAFKAKLGVLSSHDADVRQTVQIPIQRVIVKGGNEADRARANTLFSPVVGTIPNDIYLEKVIATLESQGLYEYIRVQRTDDKSIPTLSVVLSRRGKPNHSLRLGVEYAATYSGSTENVFSLSPGVVFRGLTTEDSRLSANVRLLDSPAFETSFVQPIGTYLFVEGLFSVRQEADAYMGNPTMNYLYQTGSMDIGINIGVKPARWFEISTGFSYEWIQADQNPDILAGDEMDSAPLGHILLSMQRFDSPVFPVEGFSAKVRYVQSLSDTGTFRIFRTLLAEGLFIPALNCPFSFTVWGKAGSDFSEYADDPAAAPWYYKLNLANRQFFPGPLESRERIGSYIAGFGLEGKFQLNWATNMIGFPAFALLQISVGTVLQDSADINQLSACTHWNSALGIGTRLNDAFGASVRVGVSSGFDHDFRPFIALDLGSLGYRK